MTLLHGMSLKDYSPALVKKKALLICASDDDDDDIFVKLQLGSHPVAVAQYTFTHKQYTKRHKTNNT
jgi:hypothetical protein